MLSSVIIQAGKEGTKRHSFLRMLKSHATLGSFFFEGDISAINFILMVLCSLFQNNLSYSLIKLSLEVQLKGRLSALWRILLCKKAETLPCCSFVGLWQPGSFKWNFYNRFFWNSKSTKRKTFPLAVLPNREFGSENIWFLQDALLAETNSRSLKQLLVSKQ